VQFVACCLTWNENLSWRTLQGMFLAAHSSVQIVAYCLACNEICLGVLCRVCFLAAHSKVQFVACWVARNGICNPVSSCQTYHAICLVTINSQIIRANGLLVAQLWDGNSSLHRVACRSRCKEQLVLVNYLHSVYLLRKWFPKPGGTQGVGLRILDDVISTERITTGFGFFTP